MSIKVSSLYVCLTIAALLFYIGAGLLVVLRKVKNAKQDSVPNCVSQSSGLDWLCYNMLCYWSTKLKHPALPIRYKTVVDRGLVFRVSPTLGG